MFHAGHVAILKQAREFGDYLIAGVHSDEVVNAQRGLNMPIMNLNERVLSVLGCAYVNDVLIDAPLQITRFVFELVNFRLFVLPFSAVTYPQKINWAERRSGMRGVISSSVPIVHRFSLMAIDLVQGAHPASPAVSTDCDCPGR